MHKLGGHGRFWFSLTSSNDSAILKKRGTHIGVVVRHWVAPVEISSLANNAKKQVWACSGVSVSIPQTLDTEANNLGKSGLSSCCTIRLSKTPLK